MGKTLMDGKSKNERPTKSESFDSFREIKMLTTSGGNANNGQRRNGEARQQRNPADALGTRSSVAQRLGHFPGPGSIGEEDEEESASPQSDSRLFQSNQRFTPSAPPRTRILDTPESIHLTSKSGQHPTYQKSYDSPGKKALASQDHRRQQSPTKQSFPHKSPNSSPEKGPSFPKDGENYRGEVHVSNEETEKMDWFTSLLTVLSMIIVVMTFPFSMIFCLKIVAEYERAVILRMGRLLPGGQGTRGPGLFFVLPCIDSVRTVELRTVTFSIPPQEVLTRDSVTVAVDAVVYYRICNPALSILNVEDAARSTRLLAQTTLRNVLGTKDLAQILMDREEMSATMQATIDAATEAWGVKVSFVN
ncbi:unnamed protein product [Mesocestoides corti]|uniref:PHB domain-containing protein n=1 Tax=Mesocestoides corti TaxID=53468 RepID=A0A0R3UQF0_MESCO|nr:unnamed protein product [Mesocestoides corti]